MDTDNLVETLEDAGLSPYQAKAYVALLELGSASASEVADESGVPDARVYDVLRKLDARGYVELYEQDTYRARVVDPNSMVDDLTAQASQLERAADGIEERWQQPELDDHAVSIVKRLETVLEAAEEAIVEAETQVHASLTYDQYERLSPALADARERGVTVHVTLLSDGTDAEPAPPVEEVCSVARERPYPAPFVVTADLQQTVFAPNPAAIEEYGIVLESRSFTYVFFWYFLCFMWLPWPTLGSGTGEQLPIQYADVRQFILEWEPRVDAGTELTVEVEGRDTTTDDERRFTGTVVGFEHATDVSTTRGSDLLKLMGTATIVVDTGEEIYTVGGLGAQHEDVEMHRITVTEIA